MRGQSVVDTLRAELLEGRFKPGSDLIQTQLAERYDVSRIPVRDALRELSEDGLVVIDDAGGARVISLDTNEIKEIFALRSLLECDCLAAATSQLDDAAIVEIDRVRRKSDLDASTTDWAFGDWDFHRAIYRHARRPRQLRMIFNLRQTCQLLIASYHTLPTRSTSWLDDHRAIVEHLSEHDGQAAVATLRRHIEGARDHLLKILPPSSAGAAGSGGQSGGAVRPAIHDDGKGERAVPRSGGPRLGRRD